MGKKQVRQQMRQIKPKAAGPNTAGATRKQRERFVQAGGMLQGYSPDQVVRFGYISIAIAVVCVLIIAACLLFLPPSYGWPDALAASIAWIFPIALLAGFVGPDFLLALNDRKVEPRIVQGQLVRASSISTPMRLGIRLVRTPGGSYQL